MDEIQNGNNGEFTLDDKGLLWFYYRLCMLNMQELCKKALEKAHYSVYTIDVGVTKMYKNLKQL